MVVLYVASHRSPTLLASGLPSRTAPPAPRATSDDLMIDRRTSQSRFLIIIICFLVPPHHLTPDRLITGVNRVHPQSLHPFHALQLVQLSVSGYLSLEQPG